jgi:hypothetical protein
MAGREVRDATRSAGATSTGAATVAECIAAKTVVAPAENRHAG